MTLKKRAGKIRKGSRVLGSSAASLSKKHLKRYENERMLLVDEEKLWSSKTDDFLKMFLLDG